MAERTPFEVLGVLPSASWDEIKRTYKSLARIYHPDRFHGSPEHTRVHAENLLKEVNAAFATLREEHRDEEAERAHDDIEIRRCPSCSARNRVPLGAVRFRCGKCGQRSDVTHSRPAGAAQNVRPATSPETACRACKRNERVSGPYCPPCLEERLGSYVTTPSTATHRIVDTGGGPLCKDCGRRESVGGHYCEECLRKRMGA